MESSRQSNVQTTEVQSPLYTAWLASSRSYVQPCVVWVWAVAAAATREHRPDGAHGPDEFPAKQLRPSDMSLMRTDEPTAVPQLRPGCRPLGQQRQACVCSRVFVVLRRVRSHSTPRAQICRRVAVQRLNSAKTTLCSWFVAGMESARRRVSPLEQLCKHAAHAHALACLGRGGQQLGDLL